MRRAPKSLVGLDIEPGYAAAVQARPGSVEVERAAVVEFGTDVVRDGEVADPVALTTALGRLFADGGLPQRVRIGIANQQIVMRTIDLPPLTDAKQLASAVRFQAQEHIAMPLEQAVLEHHSLGIVGTPDGPKARIVLVAARRDMVERVLDCARAAGLKVEGIDLSAFALIRALYRGSDGESPLAYVNVGGLTNLALAAGTLCQFTRVIPAGSETMVTELAERRALTHEHAAGWLRHVGLEAPIEAIEGDGEIVAATRGVLADAAARIADEIRTSLDFYAMQQGESTPKRVILTGPATSIAGFDKRLGEELRLEVEVRRVSGSAEGLGSADPAQLVVAAGLTISEASR